MCPNNTKQHAKCATGRQIEIRLHCALFRIRHGLTVVPEPASVPVRYREKTLPLEDEEKCRTGSVRVCW